jgi:mono/diheme cytochrome c family protein
MSFSLQAGLRIALLTLASSGSVAPSAAQNPPPVLGSTAAPRDAAQIFATTCGWCHNKGGREAGKGPQLMGSALSDAELIHRIRKGKQGFMPAFEGTFTDDELKGLVSYIRNLRPR